MIEDLRGRKKKTGEILIVHIQRKEGWSFSPSGGMFHGTLTDKQFEKYLGKNSVGIENGLGKYLIEVLFLPPAESYDSSHKIGIVKQMLGKSL